MPGSKSSLVSTFAIVATSIPWGHSSTICARRQVTTDPLPRRTVRTGRRPSSSSISHTRRLWGKAIEVPGSAALNKGGSAQVNEVSCAGAGSCSAGGAYVDGSGHVQAFMVVQRNGRWGMAIEVPGSGALNKGGDATVYSVSCTGADNCSAGGSYADGSGHFQVFVVTKTNGRWGNAIEVPGSAALNKGGKAEVNSVSCTGAGSCSAGGYYGTAPATSRRSSSAGPDRGRGQEGSSGPASCPTGGPAEHMHACPRVRVSAPRPSFAIARAPLPGTRSMWRHAPGAGQRAVSHG